jgi:hypothetical protein
MFKKSLFLLILVNFFVVLAFVISFIRLPFVLCNFIYSREFVTPQADSAVKASGNQPTKKLNVLPLLPLCFCLTLPALIKFDSSLGWSPVVSMGFSILLCIVIIALYGGVKTAIKGTK